MNKSTHWIRAISEFMNNLWCLHCSSDAPSSKQYLVESFLTSSLIGTYEYVNMITAVAIGLSLAHCAYQNGHIAVDFILQRCSRKIQTAADILNHIIAISFWAYRPGM